MDHYIDIRVLPDPEFKETVLMSALFSKLHRHIGKVEQGNIAVSFPEYSTTLGAVLRVHGNKSNLEKLQALNWLKGLRDYSECTDIKPTPDGCQYRTVKRIQAKSVYNKRKRIVAKGWGSAEEAEQRIPDGQERQLNLPYVQIKSLSTDSPMRVYIEHGKIQDEAISGEYTSYGLSTGSTIPWF